MRLLVATSCLFATVVLHAYCAYAWMYHHLYLLVLVLSIIVHSTNDPWVLPMDKAMAHVAFMFTLSEGLRIEDPRHLWLAVFPCVVLALWVSEGFYPRRAVEIHAVLHVVSVVGLHGFLMVLYPMYWDPWLHRAPADGVY